jgi:hypothetical protein
MRPLPPGYNPKGNPRPRPRPRPITNFGGPRPRPIQPGPSVDPSGPRPFKPNPFIDDPAGPRPGINPLNIPPGIYDPSGPRSINFPPELINPVRPGMQQPVPRDPGYGSEPRGPIFLPRPDGTLQNMHPAAGGIRPGVQPSGYSQYGPRGFGPMQGVGDPRRGAATIPGNQLQMQMRGPQQAPMQQFSYGGRAGYQMGGGIMGLENGQEESIFPRLENLSQNLGQAEQTLGSPYNNQFNVSSMTSAFTGRPQMNRGGRIGYQEGGSPEEEMENIKQFYYGRRRGEQEDLLDEYQRFKMRKDFLRRYPRDEARFGGRMGYASGGIGSLVNRQGYFLGDIVDIGGDIAGDIFDIGGDILGGIGDIGGDILGNLDLGQIMQIYNMAAPFTGLPPVPGMGGIPGGEGGLGSLGNILGNFMPQEGGGGGGFNPFEFGANLISNSFPNEDDPNNEGRGRPSTDMVSILTNILNKLLTKEGIAGTTATTVGKLTYDEMKRLNDLREKEFKEYKKDSAKKRKQYRTAEGRETLPGYNITGVPQTTADVFRAPAMKGGIMNVPTGEPRRNSVGVKELDYRQSGGFVPPIGVKEKADDIPAMLSNNEFVFTADAVRAAGGGSVNKGAQKMYGLMKQLEGKA